MSESSRTNAVSRYIRARLRHMQREGATLKGLAERVAMTPSVPSQVLGGAGVGGKNLPKFAEMIGLSLPELFAEAEAWALEHPNDEEYTGISARVAAPVALPQTLGRDRARSIAEQLGVAAETINRVDQIFVGQERDERWWLLQYLLVDQALSP
ncbi:MAG: hypothetical protein EBR82_12285 [Caulobacteraceae bacterium]|nr:hypothetical protein [Caulobacteraceae bacterium]